jgi:hypothetical protein
MSFCSTCHSAHSEMIGARPASSMLLSCRQLCLPDQLSRFSALCSVFVCLRLNLFTLCLLVLDAETRAPDSDLFLIDAKVGTCGQHGLQGSAEGERQAHRRTMKIEKAAAHRLWQ